jgi:zinc protease
MRAAPFILIAAALASAAPASAELDLSRAQVSHLTDGLTVVMLEDHSFPVVSVQMLYKSGSAAETPGKTGLAHFMEHLAFRGSSNFPDERATELIYDAGGEWHGYTAIDQTTYFATMPKEGLDLLLKIEADRMARTIIDPTAIEAEKGAVITELHSYENDPSSVLQDAVTRTAIQVHPYGSPMAGYVSDVRRLGAQDARDYYAGHYSPANAVLAVVGDFVPAEAHALIAQEFADVPERAVAPAISTAEPPQGGPRTVRLSGAVQRQYFLLAFPEPAASSPDFPAFLVLQQILSGGSGVNMQQSDWSATPSIKGSMLFGAANDIATWLPPTRDPFLFMISGSIAANADRSALERDLERRVHAIGELPIPGPRLEQAKATVIGALAEDVQTTADAAHQLAFFEGIGALDALLSMPGRIRAVSAADVQLAARRYLQLQSSTLGWMVPGPSSDPRPGTGAPLAAADRRGAASTGGPAGEPQLRRLSGGLPAFVQPSPLSSSVTVELLVDGASAAGAHPADLPGLDSIVRSGRPDALDGLIDDALAGVRRPRTDGGEPSDDPATRLQQLISTLTGRHRSETPALLAVIVAGDVVPGEAFKTLEHRLGAAVPARLRREASPGEPPAPKLVRARIAKPLSQGEIGYVVEGPPPGTRSALAWRMLLYVLTHDYSGRLGRSAITAKGIVYHIYSSVRTDGRRSWATIWTGVDPDKADAMEAELRSQLAKLVADPPSLAEVSAAREHILGRDLTGAQSNPDLASKLARQFVETGALRSHQQLKTDLDRVTPADLAASARTFASGTIVRVDVLPRTP